jgi:hypothetical protein
MSSRQAFGVATVSAVVVVLAIHALQFPGSVPDFTRASGGGVLLDAVPAFGVDAVYGRLAGYGEAGRSNYAFRNVTVDTFLPFSVFPFLFLLARRALTARSTARSVGLLILAVPVAYVVFDLLENASVLTLLASYPERRSLLAESLPYVTLIKRAASLLALGVPLVMLSVAFLPVGTARQLRQDNLTVARAVGALKVRHS